MHLQSNGEVITLHPILLLTSFEISQAKEKFNSLLPSRVKQTLHAAVAYSFTPSHLPPWLRNDLGYDRLRRDACLTSPFFLHTESLALLRLRCVVSPPRPLFVCSRLYGDSNVSSPTLASFSPFFVLFLHFFSIFLSPLRRCRYVCWIDCVCMSFFFSLSIYLLSLCNYLSVHLIVSFLTFSLLFSFFHFPLVL